MNAFEKMMMTINMSIKWSKRTMKLLKTPSFPLKDIQKKRNPVAKWSNNFNILWNLSQDVSGLIQCLFATTFSC